MKQPLVLLHGWGVNSLIWNPILPSLSDRFELTRIDLPGYGGETDYAGDYSMESVVDDVLARAPDKANWIGWSLGASIAMEAAIAYPKKFLKLQLISPTPRFLKGGDWNHGVDVKAYQSLATGFEEDYAKAVQRFLLLQVHSSDRSRFRKSRSLVRELTETINQHQRPTTQTLLASLRLLGETDLRGRLSDLKIETQVIAGKSDSIVPVEASEHLFSCLAHGSSLQLFESGHLAFLEQPTKYIGALTQFLASNS